MSGRFSVVNQEYVNTGGGCMVYAADVYDRTANAMRYFICNEEGFNWQTANTVLCEGDWLEDDSMLETIVLGTWNWDALTTEPMPDQYLFDDDEFELFKYCQFEYIKRDCKYFAYRYELPVDQLPNEHLSALTTDYIEWLHANDMKVETDGYRVFIRDEYIEYNRKKNDENYQSTKDFSRWLEELKYGPLVGEHYITVTVNNKTAHIPLHADSYDSLQTFINDVLGNW